MGCLTKYIMIYITLYIRGIYTTYILYPTDRRVLCTKRLAIPEGNDH